MIRRISPLETAIAPRLRAVARRALLAAIGVALALAARPSGADDVVLNEKADGYRGIWYANQPSDDEYAYKYSGGLGTYCAKHIPFAWHCPEVAKTFFVFGGAPRDDPRRLLHMVSYFDHATGEVPRPTILLDKKTSDAHDNPVLSVDEDGRLWIFSSSHGTERPSYVSRSVEPYSIDRFERVHTGNFSYPQPHRFPGRGFLFLHTHYTKGRTLAMTTSADGADWSPRRFLARIGEGHYGVSGRWNDKAGLAFNYHPKGKGLNWRTNLYYMETSDMGETWTNAAGEPLAPMLEEVANPALVRDCEAEGLLLYMKDIGFDSAGRPIVLHLTSKGYESGPKNMPRLWATARWTGAEWEVRSGDIVSDNNYDVGSLYVESDSTWRLVAPTAPGPQPFNPGGEMEMWETTDGGARWTKLRTLTRGSEYNHTYARRPVNVAPGFYAFWADGHGRRPSESRLYFCDRDGAVFRLPFDMEGDTARPERIGE